MTCERSGQCARVVSMEHGERQTEDQTRESACETAASEVRVNIAVRN